MSSRELYTSKNVDRSSQHSRGIEMSGELYTMSLDGTHSSHGAHTINSSTIMSLEGLSHPSSHDPSQSQSTNNSADNHNHNNSHENSLEGSSDHSNDSDRTGELYSTIDRLTGELRDFQMPNTAESMEGSPSHRSSTNRSFRSLGILGLGRGRGTSHHSRGSGDNFQLPLHHTSSSNQSVSHSHRSGRTHGPSQRLERDSEHAREHLVGGDSPRRQPTSSHSHDRSSRHSRTSGPRMGMVTTSVVVPSSHHDRLSHHSHRMGDVLSHTTNTNNSSRLGRTVNFPLHPSHSRSGTSSHHDRIATRTHTLASQMSEQESSVSQPEESSVSQPEESSVSQPEESSVSHHSSLTGDFPPLHQVAPKSLESSFHSSVVEDFPSFQHYHPGSVHPSVASAEHRSSCRSSGTGELLLYTIDQSVSQPSVPSRNTNSSRTTPRTTPRTSYTSNTTGSRPRRRGKKPLAHAIAYNLPGASSLYGGGVTIAGGPPDETFKDEYGNVCTKYVNRTIIINQHMAEHAETRHRQHRIDSDEDSVDQKGWRGAWVWTKKKFASSDGKRIIAGCFVLSTLILLLLVVVDTGAGETPIHNKEDLLAAAMRGPDINDDWWDDDDDDAGLWESMTSSAKSADLLGV